MESRSQKRPLRLFGGGLLLALLVGIVAGQGTAPGNGDEPPNADAVLPETIVALEPAARDLWPETFAGLWITGTSDQRPVSIAFTKDAAENVATLARGFPRPELLKPVTLGRSIAALEARQDQMIADRELVRAGSLALPGVTGAGYDLGIDQPHNAVYVVLEQATPEATAAFKGAYGADVDVRQGEIMEPSVADEQADQVDEITPDAAASCTRSDCRYRLRSGLIARNSSGAGCSTGFTVRRPSDGTRFALSAAHCTGVARYHGGEFYGNVVDQQQAYRVDAEQHSVTGAFAAKPWIRVTESETRRKVFSEATWEGTPEGRVTCISGLNGERRCGEILNKHYSPSYVPHGRRFLLTGYCSKDGDSGAGVYGAGDHKHRAFGINSGGNTDSGEHCRPNSIGLFGHIEYVENALSVEVVKRP